MATINGNLSTGNVNQTNRIFDFTEEVFLKKPDQAPFTALMTAMRETISADPKFYWFNRGQRPDETAINLVAGYADSATSLVVDDASIFIPGDIIAHIDPTTGVYNERMTVLTVTTGTNTITVTRGIAGTTAVALVDGDVMVLIASAFSENSSVPDSSVQKLTEYYNYTQIFKLTHEVSRTFMHTDFHAGGEKLKKRREEHTDTFRRLFENAMIWGVRGIENGTSASPKRYTGGLQQFINLAIAEGVDNTYAVPTAGALTENLFETFLGSKAFAYGSKEKWALCSQNALNVMNQLQGGKVRLTNFTTEFGLNITKYSTSSGVLNFVRHDSFNKGIYANSMMIFDPDNIAIKRIGDSLTTFQSDVGLETKDGGTDLWLSEAGLQVMVPESLAFISNIVSAA